MRITIDLQEIEITGKSVVQTAQTTGILQPAEAGDGGSPAPDLIEAIQGAASLGKTAGRETPNSANDGGGAPVG